MSENADAGRRRGWFQPRAGETEAESTAARIDEVIGILATGVRRVLETPAKKPERPPDGVDSK